MFCYPFETQGHIAYKEYYALSLTVRKMSCKYFVDSKAGQSVDLTMPLKK